MRQKQGHAPSVVAKVEFSPSSDAGHRLKRVFELLFAKHSDNHFNGKQHENKTVTAVKREEIWRQQ